MKYGLSASLLGLGLLCQPVAAQIYELAFTDTNNATVVKSPTLTWYNPKSTVTVTHIAGLDRKVKLELLQGDTVVSTQTSELLTLANRITASDGKEFYGVKFTIPKPEDGKYTLRSTVYDISGAQVSANKYVFNVDSEAPTLGEFSWGMGYGGEVGPRGIPAFSTSEARFIKLAASDPLSGLAGGSFKTILNNGDVYAAGAANVVIDGVMLGDGGANSVKTSHIPDLPGSENTMVMTATDAAGNAATKSLQFWNNSQCHVPAPIAVAIQDPDSPSNLFMGQSSMKGFSSIADTTPVKVNPVDVIFKVPKTDLRGEVGGELGGSVETTAMSIKRIHDDGTHVYLKVKATVSKNGEMDWPYSGWTDLSKWRCAPMAVPNPVFSLSATAPEITGTSIYIDGIGWISKQWRDYRKEKPESKISKGRVSVEVRGYDQSVSTSIGNCVIPAGQDACEFIANVPMFMPGTIGGDQYKFNVAKSSDSSLQATPRHLNVFYDNYPPIIVPESVRHDPAAKTISFTVREYKAGAIWNYVNISSAGLKIKNITTSKESTIQATSLVTNGQYSTVEVNYSTIADGKYELWAFGEDKAGNIGKSIITTITNDGTPPVISFNYNGDIVTPSITTIRDLRVILTDKMDAAPTITSLSLSGGPLKDALQLGFSKQANGWAPEVPRMFPTLQAGQEYTLTVHAKDAKGNMSTKSQTFSLTPTNLVSAPDIKTFAVAQALKDQSDVPLALVRFKGALTDGQTQSRGNQVGYITLSPDSAFGVIFNGLLVQPGETKDVVIPLDSTGQANLPIYPATSGVAGKASYMIDIPQLTAN